MGEIINVLDFKEHSGNVIEGVYTHIQTVQHSFLVFLLCVLRSQDNKTIATPRKCCLVTKVKQDKASWTTV